MSVESRMRAAVLAFSGVATALPGGLWTRLPQNPVFPLALYALVAEPRLFTMDQAGNSRWASTGWARFQFTALSNDGASGRAQVIAGIAAIREAVKTFDLSLETGATFGAAPNFVITERSGDNPETMPPVYTQSLDVRMFFRDQ